MYETILISFFMKHIHITSIFLFLFSIQGFTQSNICYPDQSNEFWMIGLEYGSKKLSGCDSQATYNCHGFTKAMMENTCFNDQSCCTKPSWTQAVNTPYTCPNNMINESTSSSWKND